jgi:hypothetical protein
MKYLLERESKERLTEEYKMCWKSSWNFSINNIFLYLELTEYYPFKIVPHVQQNALLLPPFPF